VDPAGESVHANDLEFVGAPRDQFVLIASFELEGNPSTIRMHHARQARHGLSDWSGRQVGNFDLDADCALSILQPRQHSLARRVFEKPNEPGRTENRRHFVVGEVNRM